MTRLLTLLLIAQIKAEWVEISQQHYRKPIRTHSPFTTPDKVIDVEDTSKPWTYNNRSVTEYNWNKDPAKPPSIGNVKRVQHIDSTVKTTERVKLEEDDLDLHVDFKDYELGPNYGPTRATIELQDKQKGTIERVPNLGNIKRVQLNNSPVKSPTNYRGDREKYSNNLHEIVPHNHDNDGANDFKYKKSTEAFRRIYVNKLKNPHGTERTATFPPDNDEDSSFTEEITFNSERSKQEFKNHTTVRDFYSTKPTFITESEDFTKYETQENRFYKITNSKSSEVTDSNNVYTTELIETDEDIVTKTPIFTKSTTAKANRNNVHKNINDFKAKSHVNNVQVSRNDEKLSNPVVNDDNAKRKGNNDQPRQDHAYEKETKYKNDEVPPFTKAEKNKVNTMENVIKFMRVVADTISKNSRRSFGGKMQYLHELKESILANIEERIDTTWPDDDNAGARRHSRSAHASPSPRGHGHVQFPSSESALMTISFLTFAVFLIKLVLPHIPGSSQTRASAPTTAEFDATTVPLPRRTRQARYPSHPLAALDEARRVLPQVEIKQLIWQMNSAEPSEAC